MTSIYNKYIFNLPIIPKVVSDIVGISDTSDISAQEISEILQVDPYLTCRILKIANSSFYSRQREISSLKEAVNLVGLKKIKTICLLIAGSEIISNKKESFYHDFWLESINTAFIAQQIAIDTGKEVIQDDIFTAGILHNIGQAILYNFSNEKYLKVIGRKNLLGRTLSELEIEEFGISNNEVAAGVLQSWEFPKLLVDCVKYYLNSTAHSQFQHLIDIVSISKLINYNICNIKNEQLDLLKTYQSRLNLRTSQIDYYSNELYTSVKQTPFYNICLETVFS